MNKQLEKLCDCIARDDFYRMNQWQWGQGVCIYAMERAYDKTKNQKYLDYIQKWIYRWLEKETPGFSINTTAPFNGVLALYKNTGDEKYMELCSAFADYIMGENPRCDRGALEHTCVANSYPNEVWIDTVFMAGVFLARYGLITGKRMYVNEALRQLVLHYDMLSCENGLLYHGYYCNDRTHHGAIWGRGNCWFSVACAVILEMVDDSYPLKKEVEKRFIHHCQRVLWLQREDGSWGTIVDDVTSYSETTGTAGFTFGLAKAIELGYMDASVRWQVDKAQEYLASNIGEDGAMNEGSDGTSVRDELYVYRNTRKATSEFSQGLAILAFTV